MDNLSKIQGSLRKNYSNPVFSADDKNKLLQKHRAVENLGKTLYRYNTLKQNNMLGEAKNEEGEISTLLKGGISNLSYIWHSENSESTCEECAALDGTQYGLEDEIPERPHPNCQCYVEIVGNLDDEEEEEDEEPCNCVEQLEELIEKLEEIVAGAENLTNEMETDNEDTEERESNIENIIFELDGDLELLSEEYGQHLFDCENNIDALYDEILAKKEELQNLLQEIRELLESIIVHIQVLSFFASNYLTLLWEAYVLEQAGMDKYRHSVAHCQSAQLGELGDRVATGLSDYKELFDQYKNIYAKTHKVSEKEALADSERDQIANRLGRERGQNNPNCDCRVLMQDLKPQKRK